MNTSLDSMMAYVSARSVGGASLYSGNAAIQVANIESFTSDRFTERAAVGKLVDMGFQAEVVSSPSSSINTLD